MLGSILVSLCFITCASGLLRSQGLQAGLRKPRIWTMDILDILKCQCKI